MRDCPDLVAFRLSEGHARLRKSGLVIGEIKITRAPDAAPADNLRIIKQQIGLDGRVNLVVVYELSSIRKEV